MSTQMSKNALVSLIVGTIFGLGLALSGMTQPQKVIGFLDLFGDWDPSLVFVMGGAVVVHLITYRWIRKRPTPLLSTQWHVPTKNEITPQLIMGSILFGVGWGLAGYCPGPALTSLASGSQQTLVFVVSMLVGMLIYKKLEPHIKLRK